MRINLSGYGALACFTEWASDMTLLNFLNKKKTKPKSMFSSQIILQLWTSC